MRRARGASGGFTLLEIIIALGILAIGATTALALLVAATATGRHAEHLVNSALIADSVLSEVEGDLNGAFTKKALDALEPVVDAPAKPASFGDGPIRAVPYVDRNGIPPKPVRPAASPSPSPSKRPAPAPSPTASPSAQRSSGADTNEFVGPPRPFDDDPFSGARTVWYERDKVLPAYPDYKYDVALTPIGGPPDDPWEFLVEVTVRWAERGAKKDASFQTVFLKKLAWTDVKPQ